MTDTMNNQPNKKWEYSLRAIIGVISFLIPCIAFASYEISRNPDGLGTPIAYCAFYFGAAIIIPTILIFSLVISHWIKDKKIYIYLFLVIVLVFPAFHLGRYVGETAWDNELEQNEKTVQGVITLLEAYKTTHNEYPDSLYQIGKGGLTLPSGGRWEELHYTKSDGHFRLYYYCDGGWSRRVYESQTGQWGLRDC